jgi:hypothetical protein
MPSRLTHAPGDLPATASTAPAPASAPGVYYGDHGGRTAADEDVVVDGCDDATYTRPQLHGSVGVGVMSGSHVEGYYQRGSVSLSKAFGSCDHPSGGVSVSIGTGSGHFHGRDH